MASVFVKVLVSERLPKINPESIFTNCGEIEFNKSDKKFTKQIGGWIDGETLNVTDDVKWWLEEIELPSEDEVFDSSPYENHNDDQCFLDGAKFILNKLKGETK